MENLTQIMNEKSQMASFQSQFEKICGHISKCKLYSSVTLALIKIMYSQSVCLATKDIMCILVYVLEHLCMQCWCVAE